MVEKRNVVAEAGCTSGCDSHHLGGVGFLDDPLRPTLESFNSSRGMGSVWESSFTRKWFTRGLDDGAMASLWSAVVRFTEVVGLPYKPSETNKHHSD